METFVNRYGIVINRVERKLKSSYFDTEQFYVIKNYPAEDWYINIRDFATIGKAISDLNLEYEPYMELITMEQQLPTVDDNGLAFYGLVDYQWDDILIPTLYPHKYFVFNGYSKVTITLPPAFFRPIETLQSMHSAVANSFKLRTNKLEIDGCYVAFKN